MTLYITDPTLRMTDRGMPRMTDRGHRMTDEGTFWRGTETGFT